MRGLAAAERGRASSASARHRPCHAEIQRGRQSPGRGRAAGAERPGCQPLPASGSRASAPLRTHASTSQSSTPAARCRPQRQPREPGLEARRAEEHAAIASTPCTRTAPRAGPRRRGTCRRPSRFAAVRRAGAGGSGAPKLVLPSRWCSPRPQESVIARGPPIESSIVRTTQGLGDIGLSLAATEPRCLPTNSKPSPPRGGGRRCSPSR